MLIVFYEQWQNNRAPPWTRQHKPFLSKSAVDDLAYAPAEDGGCAAGIDDIKRLAESGADVMKQSAVQSKSGYQTVRTGYCGIIRSHVTMTRSSVCA
jgi:hypothetical protein